VRALKPATVGGRPVSAQLATELPFITHPTLTDGEGRPLRALPASRLHPDSDYDLVLDDNRMAAFDRISPLERRDLEARLAQRSGAVDDAIDADALVRDYGERCAIHRDRVHAKYRNLERSGDEGVDADADFSLEDADLDRAERLKTAHLMRIDDNEQRLKGLVKDAATNGMVSKIDAALLEVHWIQTTLDPAKFSLF
jgi:hypothetical protein